MNQRLFLYDAYRRLLDLFGDVVFGIPHEHFEKKLRKVEGVEERAKRRRVKRG